MCIQKENTLLMWGFVLTNLTFPPFGLLQALLPRGRPFLGRPSAQRVCVIPSTQRAAASATLQLLAAVAPLLWQEQGPQHFPPHHSVPVLHGQFDISRQVSGNSERHSLMRTGFFVVIFFPLQCADVKVEALSDVLQATVAKWKTHIPTPLPLELYTSSTFIGLFVEEQVAEVLKSFAADFASEAAAKAGY